MGDYRFDIGQQFQRVCFRRNGLCLIERKKLTFHASRSMVSTVFAPGVPEVENEFNSTSSAMSSLMVSIYVMGSAVGPLFLTPLTEVSGRLPMTHFANILFMIAAIVCSAAVNMPMLIIARLFMGVASSVPVTGLVVRVLTHSPGQSLYVSL